VIAWLLRGDVAVAYQATRDLRGDDNPALQERIAIEGDGAALLAARRSDGHWGRGFYQPKWTSTHYTLLELADLGLPRDNEPARSSVAMLLRTEKGPDGGLNPIGTGRKSDVCVNGIALGYCSWFGSSSESLASVVDCVLAQRMADGGFNCRFNRSGATHSSVHSSVNVIEGATRYLTVGHAYRAEDVQAARDTAAEFLVRHSMFRSHRTGTPIHPEMTRLHHPARWRYDVLRGLDALRAAGIGYDPRMSDAVDILRSRRRADGRWAANRAHPGQTHLRYPAAGEPNRWVSLIASRVLRAYG